MTVSTYEPTYEPAPATSEDSMFGTPVYARRTGRRDKNNKVFIGAAAVGAVAALGALLFVTSAANDGDDARAVAAAQPLPASRALPITPVTTAASPAAQPVLRTAVAEPALRPSQPATLAATPRATPAPRARIAAAAPSSSAPSAIESGANVSAREYAPVTPEPAAAPDPAPAQVITAEPPAAEPIPVIAE